MKSKPTTILIIGGGIAGLSTAIGLRRLGHQVLVWERESNVKRKVCGEYLSPLGVEIAKELNLDETLKTYQKVQGMNLIAPNGILIETSFPAGYGLSLNRQRFEQDLMKVAIESGVEVILGETVKKIEFVGDQWIVNNRVGDLLIGADGRQSVVAKNLGLTLNVEDKKIALHFYLKRHCDYQRRGEMVIIGDGGYVGINPISKNEDNLSWVGSAQALKRLGGREKLLRDLFKNKRLKELYGENPIIGQVSSVSHVSHRVSNVAADRAILVGDAAGFIDPLTGEGMTRALESAKQVVDCFKSSQRLEQIIKRYIEVKGKSNHDKNILNTTFQWIIKYSWISNLIGFLLSKSQRRANIFIGIIGNVYSPKQGIRYLLFPPSRVGDVL